MDNREAMMNTYRLAQIVEWSRSGQACIALLRGTEVVGRFDNWTDARRAYRAAVKEG